MRLPLGRPGSFPELNSAAGARFGGVDAALHERGAHRCPFAARRAVGFGREDRPCTPRPANLFFRSRATIAARSASGMPRAAAMDGRRVEGGTDDPRCHALTVVWCTPIREAIDACGPGKSFSRSLNVMPNV
jgi:hypothetical protein